MNRALLGVFLTLLIAILFEGVIYLNLQRNKPLPVTVNQPEEISLPVKPTKEPPPSPSPFLMEFQLGNGQTDIAKGRGLFIGWEKIANSNDLYALIKNPQKGNVYKVRVLIDKSLLATAVGAKDLRGGNRTRLETKTSKYYFYNLTPEEREKLLPKNQMVTFYTIPLTKKEAAEKKEGVRRDSKGVVVIVSLIIGG